MIYVLLSIFFGTILIVTFKVFERFSIPVLPAIVVNYLVAFSVGIYLTNQTNPLPANWITSSWVLPAVIEGFLFISLFYITALVAQRFGVSVASVANKMSIVAPLAVAFLFFHEPVTWIKAVAILMALIAVVCTSVKDNSATQSTHSTLSKWLPFILFLGSSLIDGLLSYTQKLLLPPQYSNHFLIIIFGISGILGLVTITYLLYAKKEVWKWKCLPAGIILGLCNYGSMFFILKALQHSGLPSSVYFPLNNLSVVLVSALVSYLFFRERFSKLNYIGIGLSVLAIVMLSL